MPVQHVNRPPCLRNGPRVFASDPVYSLQNVFRVDYEISNQIDWYNGLTLNYDNQPVEGATDTDYVFQTTLGWEL